MIRTLAGKPQPVLPICDLSRIKQLCQEHSYEDSVFRIWLKCAYAGVNRTMAALHRKYSSAIDCTKCANCCKGLSLPFKQGDLHQIASSLGQSIETFTDKFANDRGDVNPPCPVLDGNLCSIYSTRPRLCREFPPIPRTNNLFHILSLLPTCPILFNVMDELKTVTGWRMMWPELRKKCSHFISHKKECESCRACDDADVGDFCELGQQMMQDDDSAISDWMYEHPLEINNALAEMTQNLRYASGGAR